LCVEDIALTGFWASFWGNEDFFPNFQASFLGKWARKRENGK